MLQAQLFYKTAVIAAGASQSAAVDLGGFQLAAVYMPGTFIGTSISFQGAPGVNDGDGNYTAGTYVNIHDDTNTRLTPAIGTSRQVPVKPFVFARFVKVTSETGGSPTVETGGATITLVLKPW